MNGEAEPLLRFSEAKKVLGEIYTDLGKHVDELDDVYKGKPLLFDIFAKLCPQKSVDIFTKVALITAFSRSRSSNSWCRWRRSRITGPTSASRRDRAVQRVYTNHYGNIQTRQHEGRLLRKVGTSL